MVTALENFSDAEAAVTRIKARLGALTEGTEEYQLQLEMLAEAKKKLAYADDLVELSYDELIKKQGLAGMSAQELTKNLTQLAISAVSVVQIFSTMGKNMAEGEKGIAELGASALSAIPSIMGLYSALKALGMANVYVALLTAALTVLSVAIGYFIGKEKAKKQAIEDAAAAAKKEADANKELLDSQLDVNKSLYDAAEAYEELKNA